MATAKLCLCIPISLFFTERLFSVPSVIGFSLLGEPRLHPITALYESTVHVTCSATHKTTRILNRMAAGIGAEAPMVRGG